MPPALPGGCKRMPVSARISCVNPPASLQCVNHPDRGGIGICVQCGQIVCTECSTKVDRVNYCNVCLAIAQERAQAVAPVSRQGELVAALVALALCLPLLTVLLMGLGLALAAI